MSQPITIQMTRGRLAALVAAFLVLQVGIVLATIHFARLSPERDTPAQAEDHAGTSTGGHDEKGGSHEDHDAEAEVEGRILLSPQAVKNAGLEVRTAGPGKIDVALGLPGEVVLNANALVHVSPRIEGTVKEIRKWVGNSVRKGEVLAILESRKLANMQKDVLAAEERLEVAQAAAERSESLAKDNLVSQEKLVEQRHAAHEAHIIHANALRALEQVGVTLTQKSYEIVAPISGTIIQQHIGLGELLGDDAQAFVITDLSNIWVNATVYARDLQTIRVGQSAVVEGEGIDSIAKGTITYVDPMVGEQTRSATARIVLKDAGSQWKPGLFVTVRATVGQTDVAVAVHNDGVQTVEGKDTVFVITEGGFQARHIKLGQRSNNGTDLVEVLEGLDAGERYVSRNSFILKAELGKSEAGHEH